MAGKRCREPKATRRVFNAGTGAGPKAWCPGCKSWQPAEQVPWGKELRDRNDKIVGTFAPIPHGEEATMADVLAASQRWASRGAPRHPFQPFGGDAQHFCRECGGDQVGVQHGGRTERRG